VTLLFRVHNSPGHFSLGTRDFLWLGIGSAELSVGLVSVEPSATSASHHQSKEGQLRFIGYELMVTPDGNLVSCMREEEKKPAKH
jgi:hypothetical protein